VAVALLSLPAAAAAQAAGSGGGLPELRPGELLRVRTVGRPPVEGSVLAAGPDSVVLARAAGRIPVPAAAIDSLWTRGHATLPGGLIGAGIGLVGSVAISAALCSSIDEGFLCGEAPGAVLGSTLGSAAIGAGVGWMIHPWRLRFARPGAR